MRVKRPESRKAELLDTALVLARVVGYQNVERAQLAERCECSTGPVSKYFGTMKNLKRAIISHAIARADLIVIAQGIVAGEAKARAVKPELKRAAMEAACSL